VIPILLRTNFISTWYLNLETTFLKNFNERLIKQEEAHGHSNEEWLDMKIHIMSFIAEEADYVGKTLRQTDWGNLYNVYVVKIRKASDKRQILLPGPETVIEKGDKIFAVGEKQALLNFYKLYGIIQTKPLRTLKKFMETGYPDTNNALSVCPIRLRGDETYCNKSIRQGGIHEKYKVGILGLQTGGLPIIMPDPNLLIKKDDILWIMGSNKNVGAVIADYVDEAEE